MDSKYFKVDENSIENFDTIEKSSKIPRGISSFSPTTCGIHINSERLSNYFNKPKSSQIAIKSKSKIPRLVRNLPANKNSLTASKSLETGKPSQTSIVKKSVNDSASYEMISHFKPKYQSTLQNRRKNFSKFTLVTNLAISENEHREPSFLNKIVYPKEMLDNYHCTVPVIYRLLKRRVIMELKSIFSIEKHFERGRIEENECNNVYLIKNTPEIEYESAKQISSIKSNGNFYSVLQQFHTNSTKKYFSRLLKEKNKEEVVCETFNCDTNANKETIRNAIYTKVEYPKRGNGPNKKMALMRILFIAIAIFLFYKGVCECLQTLKIVNI
ncbi:hypothetical protein NPIL_604541 [Nephila pilipes]|uniref:Uncharacterized protein n=1 Tax=Nephila pilipes TaxID=299642 RepID=A0A8X6M8C2_NEPPI|nr:hypothetical protein NPIL_604541 [Nephila pilipes]